MKYLVAIHHTDDYDPSAEDEAMSQDIDALNDKMKAAGIRTERTQWRLPESFLLDADT